MGKDDRAIRRVQRGRVVGVDGDLEFTGDVSAADVGGGAVNHALGFRGRNA